LINSKLGGGWLLGVSALLVACSGSNSDGSGSCSTIKACGGDVTGTWTISSLCTSGSIQNPTTCAGATLNLGSVTASGTITFNGDGTETANVTENGTESAHFPASCYTEVQCDAFASALSMEDGVSDASCSYSGSGCSCSLKLTTQTSTTGTYQTTGSNLTVTTTGSDPETDSYCVSGNQLSLQFSGSDGTLSVITATK
jgi:hypothetical protein